MTRTSRLFLVLLCVFAIFPIVLINGYENSCGCAFRMKVKPFG